MSVKGGNWNDCTLTAFDFGQSSSVSKMSIKTGHWPRRLNLPPFLHWRCHSQEMVGNGLGTGGTKELSHYSLLWLTSCAPLRRAEHPVKTGVVMGTWGFVVSPGQRMDVLGRSKVLRVLCPNWTRRQFLTWNKEHSHAAVAPMTALHRNLIMHRVATPEYETHQVTAEQRHCCPHQKGNICSELITANINPGH